MITEVQANLLKTAMLMTVFEFRPNTQDSFGYATPAYSLLVKSVNVVLFYFILFYFKYRFQQCKEKRD